MNTVSFDIDKSDIPHITKILDRVDALRTEAGAPKLDRMSAHMDLCATHANSCAMDFERLAEADDFNLCHDFYGIQNCINRETGKLENGFLPRFHARLAA